MRCEWRHTLRLVFEQGFKWVLGLKLTSDFSPRFSILITFEPIHFFIFWFIGIDKVYFLE